MKRKYISPKMEADTVQMNALICGSITASGSSINVTIDNTEGDFGDDNTFNVKGGGAWDFDWNE